MIHKPSSFLKLYVYLLNIVGIMIIGSASSSWAMLKYQDPYFYVKKQSIFVLISIIVLEIISRIQPQKLKKYANIFLGFGFMSLLLVLFIGVERNGSKSWFGLGGFLIQPSEFFKFFIILFLAKYYENHHHLKAKMKESIVPFIFIGLGFGLIMLQPDFGSGVVMVCSCLVVIIASGLKMKYFYYLSIVGIVGAVVLIAIAPYRMARIIAFIDPWKDPLGSGFQSIQALFALGPGGLFGHGLGNSIQKLFYLPEPQTDFIFAILAEELGLIGGGLIIIIYGMIMYFGAKIALRTKDLFSCYLALGIISIFSIQVLINLGVVINLFPVTGITLPFLSYGGSSLVIMNAIFGVLCAIDNVS